MNTLIVGAGALGGLFAFLLHRSGAQVALLENDPAVIKAVSADGLRLEGISGAAQIPVSISDQPPAKSRPDLVLIMVKSRATREAAAAIRPCLHPRSIVASLQAGIGGGDILAAELGADCLVLGATSISASMLAPGQVLHTGWGDTAVATPDPLAKDRAETVAHFLTHHGIKTTVAKNLPSLLWGKTLIQVGIGALTALTRIRNGKLLQLPPAAELMRLAVKEAESIVRAAGIELPYFNPVTQIESIAGHTSDNLSSMLQDLYRGRHSEIEVINGAVVKLAESLGLDAPINRTLTLLVQAAENAT